MIKNDRKRNRQKDSHFALHRKSSIYSNLFRRNNVITLEVTNSDTNQFGGYYSYGRPGSEFWFYFLAINPNDFKLIKEEKWLVKIIARKITEICCNSSVTKFLITVEIIKKDVANAVALNTIWW